jgi:hypothetical protein
MMLFLENMRARRGCLPAASGTDWRCRVRFAKANVAARERKQMRSRTLIAVYAY